jgi:site-specific recombinase XerD
MREFAGRKLRSITTQDIQRFLAAIDREDVSARTVNIHRQLLHSIFEHARRTDVFALRDNPVAGTRKRPEEGARPIETFEPDELRAIAEAARSSLHRTRPDPRLLRGDERRVAAHQRPGRRALHRRRLHGVAAG